jgi:hypothetical protein
MLHIYMVAYTDWAAGQDKKIDVQVPASHSPEIAEQVEPEAVEEVCITARTHYTCASNWYT